MAAEVELRQDIPASPLAGRTIRVWLRQELPQHLHARGLPADVLDEFVQDVVWMVSELVENSVRHTTTTHVWVQVGLTAVTSEQTGPGTIRVDVRDQGPGLPPLPAAPADPPYRHGLDMMRVLGAVLTPVRGRDRNGVTATLDLPRAATSA